MIPGAADQLTEDRISNLGRDLIHKILEDHMEIRDAARTSILSKTWENIWQTRPTIVLANPFIIDKLRSSEDKKAATAQYIEYVNSVLLAHVGPILRLYLDIPAYSHLHDTPYPSLWIKQLSEKGVRILLLDNSRENPVKDMPSYFFSCSDLTKLYLENWKLNPPHNFRGFCNLTKIDLQSVVFTTDMTFGTQVEHFGLHNCVGIEYLDIQLTNHGENIKYFHIFRRKTERRYALDYDPYTDIKKSFNLRRLLGCMPSIETLEVDAISLKFLDPGLTLHNHLTSTMKNLKTLKLDNVAFNDVNVISNAFCLLRSMPILEHLEIKVGCDMDTGIYMKLPAEQYMESPDCADITLNQLQNGRDMDTGIYMKLPAEQYMESPDCADITLNQLQNVTKLTAEQYMESPDCADITLNQLQNVTMHDFLGSRAELLLTKLLLASSPSLRRMTLVHKKKSVDDSKEDCRIARELLQFPRKSPVQIFWRS